MTKDELAMNTSDDERMLQELSRMAEIYLNRGNFEMAEKCRALAREISDRLHRSNVVQFSDWNHSAEDQKKEG